MDFRYGPAARFFHWTIALLIVLMFILGIWITRFEPKDEAFKLRLYNLHESFGVLILALMLFRLFVRFRNPPALLESQPAFIRYGSHLNHLLIYAVLFIQPVIGFIDTNAWGFPLKWFDLIPVPSPVGKQEEAIAKQLSNAHYWGAIALLVLISLHLLGAAYHGIIKRDDVVKRMV
jgi:cytochrome b561